MNLREGNAINTHQSEYAHMRESQLATLQNKVMDYMANICHFRRREQRRENLFCGIILSMAPEFIERTCQQLLMNCERKVTFLVSV